MREQDVMTQTVNISEVRRQWSGLVNRVARRETRILVEKSGSPVAALVSTDDLRRLQELDAQRARDLAVLDRIAQAFAGVPADELENVVDRAVTEVRAARRRSKQDQPPRA